jgi:hypothetical protein
MVIKKRKSSEVSKQVSGKNHNPKSIMTYKNNFGESFKDFQNAPTAADTNGMFFRRVLFRLCEQIHPKSKS